MQNKEIKKTRNEQIAELLASGERIKDFYRFTAQNPHIDLHDACQIVLARPKASICFYMDEWNEMGRRVTKNRRGIQFYDADGSKQIVFDLHDTHGDKRYRRLIFPMRRLLYGLDELNGTEIADSSRRDYSKVLSGVAQYLDENGYFTADEQRNTLLAEGVAYSLYSKTGFPKDGNIALRGMPYELDENARLFKEIYLLTELAKEDISAAYERRINTPQVIDDIEEETVSDEPILTENPAQGETSDSPEPMGSEEKIPEPEEEDPESQEETAPAANPLYERYMAAQREKPDAAVLIRVGDFYEVFGTQARLVAEWLDITLTSRDVGLPERIPMCGFPCHVADLYIQKILEHCGAYILEPDAEPIYILPHAETQAGERNPQGDTPESRTDTAFTADEIAELNELLAEESPSEAEPLRPELVPLTEEEDPFVEESADGEPEETWEDAEEEAEPEEDKPHESKTSAKGKSEKGIQERKRKQKPQLSMFDLLEPQGKSREEQIIDTCLKDEYSGYKLAYYDAYQKDLPISGFVALFKRHYGEYSGQSDGEKWITNTTKGREIKWRDKEHPENNFTVQLKWPEVAVRIAELIENDDYLTPNEKEEYARVVRFREERESAKTDGERCKVIADQIIEYGTQKTYSEVFSEYPHFLEDYAQFYFDHREEIKRELLIRKEVSDVKDKRDMFDNNVTVSFHIRYCPRWQESLRRHLMREHRVQDFADGFIEECANHYETAPDGETIAWTVTPEEVGEPDYLFIKDNREEFIEYLQSKAGVIDAKFSMERIEITFERDYIADIVDGKIPWPGEQTQRVRAVADKIIAEGIENTTEGNWVHYFDEFGEDETFAREHAETIAAELERHQEVSDVILTPDGFDTNFYLDYCPNYVPKEDEYGYAEDLETAETEQMPIKSFNRFTELAPEEKTIFDHYVQRTYQEPRFSPWGMVQDCTVIAPGIYSVVTAGHGGMMIDAALAPHILSPEALSEGFTESGYYCYEEDAAESIPLRELYDKGILGKTNEYFTRLEYVSTDSDAEDEYIRFAALTEAEQEEKLKQWNDAVNETVEHWYPSYWEAYQQAQGMSEDNAENTDLNAVLDQSDFGGAKTRFKNNVAAIRLSKFLHERNAMATDAERKVLAKYVGWGGLPQAFDETNEQWSREYAELKELLTTEQYEKAKGSVLNAHYTSKEVIGGIYAALERFGVKGSNRILEPAMGTGNFFGYMPQEIATGAKLYGVELDTITGMIASKLYPQANVQIKGFEETSFPDDYFDLVVSNVPFGGYGVYDSEYSRQKFLIHDYFIAKSIDKVKPNGIVAVVTSKGTLDKLNPTARKYMAERAELLGAIRLPNTAFKQTANTEAVTDILFFQKRTERISDTSGIEWLGTGKTEDGFEVNNYFIAHPEMVLGTFAKETGLYGAEGITVKPDGRDLGETLAAAVNNLPQNIYRNPEQSLEETVQGLDESVFDIRPMCYISVNGKLYMRIGEKLEQQELPNFPKDAYERIAGMIALRDELRLVLDIQTRGCTDEELRCAQWKLNADYDRFVRKYGYINSQTNTRLFREDGDAALLFACEVLSEDKTRATKADVFTKRTIRPYSAPTHTNDALEALQICRNERGGVDIAYIEELTGKDYDTVINELGDAVYRDPEMVESEDKYSGYQTAEEYLSGKVVEKLQKAKYYASHNSAYSSNVAALEKVQPEPLKADEISVRIGASWVKPEYYKQFLMELLDIYWYYEDGLTIRYNPFDNSWKVERADHVRKSAGMYATEKYGTSRANAFRLFEDCLNQRATSIYDTVEEDGREKRVLNQAETIAAREKQNKIKEEFADWIYADPKRREDLEKTYNSLFNQIRLPSYDGSFLKFPGMNPAIELRPHQKNAVARIAGTGNSTLLHHVVGSGKSFTMAASAMKLRQYGLAKKPMIVVPNHLVQQMANEFRTLYPTGKLLIANKEDLEKNKRKQFVSKVAMGDWDSVIIAQSSFAKIPVSRERQERKIREEIAKIKATIDEMEEKTGTRVAVKNLERIKKGREAMLKKLTDSSKKDNVLIFENLGVDYLFVDEADSYKNLFLYTKMNNVSGISNAASARASDMQMKIEYINELHGGDKGVVFATGTPISNSMAEMYVMQTYLQKNMLKELGIDYFDGWAADFGETVTALEMAPSGQGYRMRTRFAKFTNLPELMTLYRSFADVQTADMVKLDVPEAERITVTLEPSEQTVQIAEEIAKRAEAIYNGGVDPHLDNMLKVTSDGKKLALDIRCFDPFLKEEGCGKLDECADNAEKVYEETNAIRGTQLIFCDMSTPKKPYENYEYGEDFDVYNDLKHKLIERGIPAEEIAFIHDAKTDKEKQALFDKMNEGKIRILIGSTEKCGAGTNVQKRLAALHHLDAPYRPRDLQQRDGRGIRQGNTNEEVKIFTYVTKRTLDSYCYQILENKQRFISQIENGSVTAREAEDIDETTLSYAEIKAITAANPKIKRKMELETELTRLRVLEGQYKKNLYALQDKTIKDLPSQIRTQEQLLKYAQEDEEHMRGKYNPDVFSINVLGKVYTDKKEGAAALVEALRSNKYDTPVAEYGGFRISLNPPTAFTDTRSVALTHHGSYGMEIGDSELGLITRLDNFMRDFPERKGRYSAKLEQLKRDLAVAEEELKKPFEHKGKIEEITKELSEINAELDLNKREEVVIDTGEETDDEEVNYMALPERGQEKEQNPEKRSHRRMTEKLYALYAEQKVKMPDAVIFLKNGDFYETVGEDANTAAATYGAKTYEKEFGGQNRTVAMLTYDDLDAMVNDLAEENRRFKIVEPEKEIGRDTDFLETEEEARAIAENEEEPEIEAEEEDKVYYSVVPEDKKYSLYMIDDSCRVNPVGELYATADEARKAAQTFGDEPQEWGRVEVSLDELQEYASNMGAEAKIQVPILPDYFITQEEMHEYGYLWNGVLPLTKPAMQNNFQNCLRLYEDDSEGYIASEGEIEEHDGLFGIERSDWKRFIESENGKAYLAARLFASTAVMKMVGEEYSETDVREADGHEKFTTQLKAENVALSNYFKDKWFPLPEEMQPYAKNIVNEYVERIEGVYRTEAPGKTSAEIKSEIIARIGMPEILSEQNSMAAKEELFKENREYLEQHGEVPCYVIEHNEKTGKYRYRTIGGYEILVPSQEYNDERTCRAAAPRGVELTDMEELAEISRMRCKIYPDYFVRVSENGQYYPLSKRKAQQLFNLGLPVCRVNSEAEYVSITEQSALDNTEKGFCIGRPEWYAFTRTDEGKTYLYARLLTVKAAEEVVEKDLDTVGYYADSYAEVFYEERTDLENFFNGQPAPTNEAVNPYLYGLCREYASMLDGNGKLRYANNLNRNLFYRNMHEYLQYTDTLPYAYFMALEQDDENVMSRLCEFYEQNGDLALHSYRERQEIIEQYAEKYYPEILQETKQPRYYGKGADGTVYYFLPEGLSLNTLADIKEKADEYVIAAPTCILPEEELEKGDITFVQTGRDIPDWVVYGTAATAKHAMHAAAEQARRDKKYRDTAADNARQALDNLRSDSSEAGYKERFFGAFAEFMAESDTFLEEGDYAELVKDGDAITERVYAYYMGMNEQINFEDWEELSRLTKDYIDERWKMQKAMTEGVPLYGGTFEYAKANGEENLYRQSLQANIECKHEIEQAIRNNFDGMHLNKGFENALIEKFGLERMRYVLANTVQENDWDGRYSPETKEWAKTVTVTEKSEHRSQFIIGTHPAVLDGFINRVRKLEKSYKESNEKIFEYGGYHFIPERKFTAEENGFDKISRRLKQDTEMGLCREGYAYESKYPYSHDGFYAASPDKECDLFRCIENGKLYLPCENDLQEYLAELTAEKTTEEKGQTPKEKVHYSYLYEKGPDGAGGYRAYILDESTGTLISVFQNPMDTLEQLSQAMEKEMLGYTSKFNEYVKVEPPELLRMSNQILREKEKGEEVQEEKYRAETKKGLPVVHIEKDKYGRDIAIVKRKGDFMVAIKYDVKDGTWEQGKYEFPTQDAAQKYIDKNYKPQEEEKGKWLTAKVSRDALIRRYEKHSFFRMPNGEYEEYTYNVFNNRVKDSRQLVDLQSDGHELCYELVFPADGEITIKTRDGDEVIFPAEEFVEIINGTANADYERKEREDDTDWYAISVPQEAHRGTYERSSLFSMPSKSEYAGYSYYIPNVFVEEDKRGEDGNILITLPESFHVTLRNRAADDEIVVTPFDLYTECDGTQGEDYARKQLEAEGVSEKKKQVYVTIPAAAKIAEYKTQTLFKMPHTGEYDGYCFYLFNDQLSQGDGGIQAKLSENFTVQLKDKKNDRQATLTAEQFKSIMDVASAEDFDSGLKKPSEEKADLFKGAEEQFRKNIPEEMLARPNWVAVKVFRDKKKDKLVKLPKDAKTGEAASPNDPSTWSDFDTACKFAHENGCAALGFALDGKDNICCIDIDHCFNAKREMSDIAKAAWNACGNTYREVSVSREGLHIFGKTKGMGLQVFSDAGDMEFYERGKFMTVTGDAFGEGRKNLLNLDELPVRDLLSRKFSKHKTYSWAGKGIEGLSSMPDREVLEKAFASKDGETFKALFNGEDLKNNRSNSDMALMRRLAFWCNGDIDQMLRIFAASGLYRPDKSPEYYEYSALKVLKDQSSYYHPKQSDSKPRQEKNSEGNSK